MVGGCVCVRERARRREREWKRESSITINVFMWLSYQWQTPPCAPCVLRPTKQKIEAEGFRRDAILKVFGKTNVNAISTGREWASQPGGISLRWVGTGRESASKTVNTSVSYFMDSLCGTSFCFPGAQKACKQMTNPPISLKWASICRHCMGRTGKT